MPQVVSLPDGTYWLLGDDGAYHQLDSVDDVFQLGLDYGAIAELNELPAAPVGRSVTITDGVADVTPAPQPVADLNAPSLATVTYGPGYTGPAAGAAAAAATFTWGTNDDGTPRTWGAGDLRAFTAYLAAHGASFTQWAANHPAAAAILGAAVAPPELNVQAPQPEQAPPGVRGPATPAPTYHRGPVGPEGPQQFTVGAGGGATYDLPLTVDGKVTAQGGWAAFLSVLARDVPNAAHAARAAAGRFLDAVG